MEKERKDFGELYDFLSFFKCTGTIFLPVFLDFWTWASLNFGELNLSLPPQFKLQVENVAHHG